MPRASADAEERIADHRAQTLADSVMYREALATAAEARGWSVHWYDREQVFRDAAAVLGREANDDPPAKRCLAWGIYSAE